MRVAALTLGIRSSIALRRAGSLVLAGSLLVAGPLLVVACGDDSTNDTNRDTGETLADAADRITEAARISIVGAPAERGLESDQIDEMTEWDGTDVEVRDIPSDLDVQIVYCAEELWCEDIAFFVTEATAAVHWNNGLRPAKSTEVSVEVGQALDARPDVLFLVGIRAGSVDELLDRARDSEVVTVALAPPSGDDGSADVRLSDWVALAAQVDAYAIIQRSQGRAAVVIIDDGTASAAMIETAEILGRCSGCSVSTVDTDSEPGSVASSVATTLETERLAGRTVDHLVIAAGPDVDAVASLLAGGDAGGGERTNLVVVGGDDRALALIAEGVSGFHARVSQDWLAHAAVDQTIRKVSGVDLLDADQIRVGVRLFDETNLPADGRAEPAFYDVFEWKMGYLRLWGLN